MADLVSAIHKHREATRVWMAGTGPAMTVFDLKDGRYITWVARIRGP